MPLIDLKTNLKSLKYGSDRKKGGSSSQPYIVIPIPSQEDSLTDKLKYGTGGPDILVRGGTLAPQKIIDDTLRISKFFTDPKSARGILFSVNQNILSRTGVKTEASFGPSFGGGLINNGIYNPINTLTQINANLSNFHLNQKGLDPTDFSSLGLNKYFNVVKKNDNENNNRLVNLFKTRINVLNLDPVLIKYSGGPGSVLGIGNTNIKIADQKTGINNTLNSLNKGYFLKGGLNNSLTSRTDIQFNGNKLLGASDAAFVNMDLKNPIDNGFNFPEGQQTRYYGPQDNNSTLSIDSKNIHLPTYQTQQKSWRKIDNNEAGGTTFYGLHPWGTEDFGEKDIIKFFITIIDNTTPGPNNQILYFPALIESLNDNFTADWNSQRYIGRGEEFFTYDGFSREIPLSFKVHARDRKYLNKMYDNLNILTSALTPNYTEDGFMRGNIFKITIGEYISDLPGIINNLNFNIPQETTWDIDAGLPQYIDVSLNFKPIHNFLPSKGARFIAKDIIDPETL